MMGTFEAMKKQKAERHVAHRLATAMICCGVLCSGTAFAAENSGSTAAAVDEYALDDTVVTAERIPTSKMDTPANVTVITAQEIEDNHYADVAEAIGHVNGVIISRQGGNVNDAVVRLNGDERVVVMIDGQRLNNDQGMMGKATVNLNMIPSVKNIERIEVVKGGGSALYGSDAVGGVINIITKRVKENRTTIDLNTGSWGTHNYEITNEGRDHDVSWFVTGGLQKRGYFSYKLNGKNSDMPASDYNNNSLSLRVDAKIDNASSVRLDVLHKSNDGGEYSNLIAKNRFQKELFNDWNVTYNFKENTQTPGYIRYFDNYKWEYFQGDFNTRTQGVDYQNGWELGKNNKLIAGAEWHHSISNNSASGAYDDKTITNKAAYLQDTIHLADKWSLVPGIRVDHHSMFGTHWTPKIAVNYNANNKTQVYASWGRVYKAPTADDLYYNNAAWMMYGNENLQPETGYTESVGINHQFDSKTSIQASVFQSEIHDAIYWLFNSSTLESHVTNISLEKKRGFELSFQKKINPVWSYDLGYSYIHTEADYASSTSITAKNQQPNGYRFGLHYIQGAWKANLLGTIGSGLDRRCYTTNSYTLLDFNTSYAINKQTTAYFKINNLTNQEYQEYPVSATTFYPGSGRFFQVGVTYSF